MEQKIIKNDASVSYYLKVLESKFNPNKFTFWLLKIEKLRAHAQGEANYANWLHFLRGDLSEI